MKYYKGITNYPSRYLSLINQVPFINQVKSSTKLIIMIKIFHLFGLIAFTSTFASGLRARCTDFKVDIQVRNVTTLASDLWPIKDEYHATYIANLITTREAPVQLPNLTTLSRSFAIAGKWCSPTREGRKASTLHILTHGIGFNQSYWDFYLPGNDDPQYSYVNSAAQVGYTTLLWNRLGIEPSEIGDPYTEIQANVQAELLVGLTRLARDGRIPGLPRPRKVVHIGHSFGSELTMALAANAPELTDGIVLTGENNIFKYTEFFVAASSFNLANQNQPYRFPFPTYSNGFLTWPNKHANQYGFLHYPYFDPAALEYSEATKYPFTLGEFLTMPLLPTTAPHFHGPVLYVSADQDLIFCASNCTGLLAPDSPGVHAFNASSSVEVYNQPNTGHGINLSKNATGAYNVILDWTERNF
jgi:pimeloyl-ACP methyl ester carboxylesterase